MGHFYKWIDRYFCFFLYQITMQTRTFYKDIYICQLVYFQWISERDVNYLCGGEMN